MRTTYQRKGLINRRSNKDLDKAFWVYLRLKTVKPEILHPTYP